MSAFTGTGALLRTTVRHEGRFFAPWVLVATVLSASSVLVYPWLFPDQADRGGLNAAISANPALGIILGPAFDLSTSEGFNSWRSLALVGFLTSLAAILTVVRTTRGQEDSGQAELLASGVMGRGTRLLTGTLIAVIGSLVVGLVAGTVTGLCGGSWEDSLLLGATFTASGWMFAGIAAVTGQLASDAHTASSMAIGTLGTLFMLRGVAYSLDAPDWTVWANPLGWMTETRPASGNHWWPLLLAVTLAGAALFTAFALQARRDFGQGALSPRPGPARGRIRTPWQLALRLNRGSALTWSIAFVVLGVVFGYFTTSIHDILGKDSAVGSILAAGATTPEALVSAFLVTILSLVGILAAVPGVQTMLKVRSEEMDDRVEPLLAGAVRRPAFYAAHVVLALLTPAVLVLIAGLLIATLASRADIGITFTDALVQAIVTIPATWAVVAVAVAVVGARPQVTLAVWIGVAASFALTILGPTFKLWNEVLAISPFHHVPTIGSDDVSWIGLACVGLVALLLVAVGTAGFRRRDLATT